MNKIKLVAGIILFGSLWGFSESIIGSHLSEAGWPSGIVMTSVFAVGLMMMSRILYQQRGMQVGMGLVAGTLRLFNPCFGCFICSAFAIMAEGVLFELIWYKLSLDLSDLQTARMKLSMGVITGYCCYVGGFIVTQILTPLVSSAGFYIENLIVFTPQIFSRGLSAALIGGAIIPAVILLKNIDIKHISDKLYYPTTVGVSIVCWIAVIANTLLILSA
jgi:hypothetical protein